MFLLRRVFNYFLGGKEDELLKEEIKQLKENLEELKANRVALPVPWRDVGENFFTIQKKQELVNFINDFQLPENCDNINLLMMGYICSGKSSFANTLKTVFRDNGKLANPATVYGSNWGSGTLKLHEVTLKTYVNGKKIRLYDCRGIEEACSSVFEEDLCKVVDGHVMEDYEFKDKESISAENRKYRVNPTISDQMHCVLFVSKASSCGEVPKSLNKMKLHIGRKNIPIRLVLTAMDQLDLYELKAVRSIFQSRDAQLKVESAKKRFGLHDNQILPIANYVNGTEQDIYRDVLALQAMENILQEALVFLENKA